MKVIGIDYESFYSQTYSLRRMTPVEYVLDPQFECIGAAVQEGVDGEAYWVDGVDLPHFFADLDPKNTALVSHNALFDACITSWRYKFRPAFTIDTLGIARATLGHKLKSLSLDKVAQELGLGVKGGTIHKVIGMNAAAIKQAGLYDSYIEYAINDVQLCMRIYDKLVRSGTFPKRELKVMDMVLRCATEPQFFLDQNVLAEHLHTIKSAKDQLLATVMMTCNIAGKDDLMSNEKFAEALRTLGVDPPMKTSLTTGKQTYAFAKTDPAFIELEEHDNPAVQALVAARLGHKSTLEETRTQRLLTIANLQWPDTSQGKIPMPLRYSGAHTHRLCLVGDTTIVVLRNKRVVYTRLDDLRNTDLVWDGEAFVQHGGLAYAGIKKVMSYDDVTGTPDHRVWTVESGYCPLEVAKERGYHIARGGVPDAARIDSSVQRTCSVQVQNQVRLLSVRERDVFALERPTSTAEGLVPVLPQEGTDARHGTFRGNAGSRKGGECGGYGSAALALGLCIGTPTREACSEIASQDPRQEMGSESLEHCNVSGDQSASTMHQSGRIELCLLRGARDRVPVHFDAADGGLAPDQSRSEARGVLFGSDQLRRALRTGEPSLGGQVDAVSEQVFKPTWDIVDCGPRNRFMANGRLVHNSGDWSLNMQNLPRGGALRRAIIAPPGHVVLQTDASQIEARMVAWICGQLDLIEQFANGEDVYSSFASKIFNRTITKADKAERFLGKTCLAAGTQVLTDKGWVPIQYVSDEHKLWDGIEWVSHRGLLPQGVKPTISHRGLTATGDHEILTERGWVEWSEVHTTPSLFQSALNTATLPWSATSDTSAQTDDQPAGSQLSGACAGGKGASIGETLKLGGRLAVTPALKLLQARNVTLAGVTSLGTSGSSAGPTILKTSDKPTTYSGGLPSSKQSLPTYDIANAGPRSRFTVLTDDGPVIVHNCILGMGYGVGWSKFQRTVKLQSKAQAGKVIELSDAEAMNIVNLYRSTYSAIPAAWRILNAQISVLANGGSFEFGPCIFEKGSIWLPSGLRLHYHNLRYEDDGWVYDYAGKPKRLYGGALLENIVQALARIVVMDAAVRIEYRFAKYGVRLALQVHDELVFVVPEHLVHECREILLEEMRCRPVWAKSLPLDAESDFGPNYGDAK